MTTRKPRTWESIYWASRRRGDDPAYSLFLADEWQKRQKGKQMSEKNAPNPNADALRAIFEKAGAIEDVGYRPVTKIAHQIATVGRSVHVVTAEGKHRPGVVVDAGDHDTISVVAFVLPNDPPGGSILWLLDPCPQDQSAERPGTWHWPERV